MSMQQFESLPTLNVELSIFSLFADVTYLACIRGGGGTPAFSPGRPHSLSEPLFASL
jgi:hypothetical protein